MSSRLDTFHAEIRRSPFTVRKLLKGATSRRRLWVPANVTLVGGSISVSTSEQVEEFRPHRLIWMSPESFLITGLDSSTKFKRVHLRLRSHSEAQQVASTVVELLSIPQEPLSQVEEIPVEARFLMSGRELLLQAYAFSIRLVFWGILVWAFSAFGVPGVLLGLTVPSIYLGIIIWALIQRTRIRVEAWIRLEGKALTVRTNASLTNIVPKVVEWKGSETFLLSGSGRKLQVYFPTRQEAVQTVFKIKTSFPQAREIQLKD